MENTNKATAWQLAALMHLHGIRHVVVSPGSRNAPIILALSRSGLFDLHYIVDERVAAFAALGMAVALDRPVAVVCTSGSAVLNYAPALAEAYYSHIPVVAVSADRPYFDIDQNRPQTIRQAGVLDKIVRKSVDIRDGEDPVYANRLINEALTAANGTIKGPVHINMQFTMPLTISGSIDSVYSKPVNVAEAEQSVRIDEDIKSCKSILFVGGFNPGGEIRKIRECLSDMPANLAIIAEAQSNISDFSTITPAEFEANIENITEPEHIFIAGSALVSAKISRWIDNAKCPRTYIGCTDIVFDYDSMRVPLSAFLKEYVKTDAVERENYRESFKNFIGTVSQSTVSRLIANLSGKDILLHISNGMSIREAQKISISEPTTVWANRGVSGIDGCTSTAIGSSLVSNRPVVLITGDMSAAYDIGALATKGVSGNFTMIVVNNGGGEIFRKVATTRDLPERECYFTAMPKFPLQQLAEAYDFDFISTDNPDTIEIKEGSRPTIIELNTNK